MQKMVGISWQAAGCNVIKGGSQIIRWWTAEPQNRNIKILQVTTSEHQVIWSDTTYSVFVSTMKTCALS